MCEHEPTILVTGTDKGLFIEATSEGSPIRVTVTTWSSVQCYQVIVWGMSPRPFTLLENGPVLFIAGQNVGDIAADAFNYWSEQYV